MALIFLVQWWRENIKTSSPVSYDLFSIPLVGFNLTDSLNMKKKLLEASHNVFN